MHLDTLDRKVREDTPVLLACPPFLFHQVLWRKEIPDSLEATASPASLDPEVTRVSQVSLVVRVCLDFLVLLSRVKDSRDSLVTPGHQAFLASPDQRERLELWDSLAFLEQGVMMVPLVSLVILESLVDLVPKVSLETAMDILEVLELKACQEIQATQVVVVAMAPPVTTAFQEVQVSLVQRELLVNQDGLE